MTLTSLANKIGIAFILTIGGYFIAYLFEVGFLRQFDISWQSARVTLPSLALGFITLTILIFFSLRLEKIGSWLIFPKENAKVEYLRRKLLIYFVLLIWFSFIGLISKSLKWNVILYAAYYPLFELIMDAVLEMRPGKSIDQFAIDSVNREERITKNENANSSEVGSIIAMICLVVGVLGVTSLCAGMVTAYLYTPKKTFRYMNNEYVVIREYEDTVISKSLIKNQIRIGETLYVKLDDPVLFIDKNIKK